MNVYYIIGANNETKEGWSDIRAKFIKLENQVVSFYDDSNFLTIVYRLGDGEAVVYSHWED